jgi:hypothetical protein
MIDWGCKAPGQGACVTSGTLQARREDKDLPPSRQPICSPYDTDARYATKRGSGWEGYKVHLSPDPPICCA